VLHGDYSSANLLFNGDGLAAVVDFGPPEPFLLAYELGRTAFDPWAVALGRGLGRREHHSRSGRNPTVNADDVLACARVVLIQLLTSLYGVKEHYLSPGLLQEDLDQFWVLRFRASQRMLSHLSNVEAPLADAI